MIDKEEKRLYMTMFIFDWFCVITYLLCSIFYLLEYKIVQTVIYFICSSAWVFVFYLHKNTYDMKK